MPPPPPLHPTDFSLEALIDGFEFNGKTAAEFAPLLSFPDSIEDVQDLLLRGGEKLFDHFCDDIE